MQIEIEVRKKESKIPMVETNSAQVLDAIDDCISLTIGPVTFYMTMDDAEGLAADLSITAKETKTMWNKLHGSKKQAPATAG